LHKIHPLFGILLLGLFILFNGCGGGGDSSDGGDGGTPAPTITSFVQTSGHVGDTVIITGTNFSTTVASNTVKFNGSTAVVDSSSATQIKAFVPVGATTGKISVTVGGNTDASTGDFTVTSNTPVFAGYNSDGAKNIPCYWEINNGTADRTDLAGDDTHNAYAYSTILGSNGKEYTAGHYFNGTIYIACYWEGTTRQDLRYNNDGLTNDDDTYAFSVAESNGTIYIAGYYYNSSIDLDMPCYWTKVGSNITRTDLDIVTGHRGITSSISIYNGTIYTAGYYSVDANSPAIACYWTGTARTDLGDGVIDSKAFSIIVSGGTVYTAGIFLDDTIYVPCYWTATARTDLAGDGENDAYASSLAIYNGTVYTSGFYNDGTKDIPCHWTGTTRANLAGDGTHYSEAFSIIVSDGTIYTGGSFNDGSEFIPCYWTGTTQAPVEIGEGPSEVISSIFQWLGLEI